MDQPISQLVKPVTIISLNKGDSLKDALQVLAKHNILSTPVYDGDKCIGLVDVLDFAKFVRELYFANKETSQFKNYLLQFSFEMEKVESVIDLSKRNPYIPMSGQTSFREVLNKFVDGVHRIPIVDDQGKVIFILSQMALFRHFFLNNPHYYEAIKQKTVKELGLGHFDENTQPFAVNEDDLAIDAFKQITDNAVSAVGITDKNGKKLIGVLSASDLQGFLGEEMHLLGSPVLQFKQYAKKKLQEVSNDADHYSTLDPVIFCKDYDTLESVVSRFASSHVHRIFVMDDEMQMIGVISLTDLFKLLQTNNQ